MAEGVGSTLKGQIAATLIGIACAQYSHGELNFATPFVDDQGVDLIFFKRGSSGKVILAQVKSRTTESQLLQKGIYRAQVRKANFVARDGYFFIFTTLDKGGMTLKETLWLVPSKEFQEKLKGQKSRERFVFQSGFNSNDMWVEYRLSLKDLPNRIIACL